MNPIVAWLRAELDRRRWSNNELARQAGLSPAGVSQVMNGQQNPGVDFCRGVAKAFNEPPERVFRLAGLLPLRPERDQVANEFLFYFDQMTPQARKHVRTIVRALAEDSMREEAEAVRVIGGEEQ